MMRSCGWAWPTFTRPKAVRRRPNEPEVTLRAAEISVFAGHRKPWPRRARLQQDQKKYSAIECSPSAAKAAADFPALTARLEAAPFQSALAKRVYPEPPSSAFKCGRRSGPWGKIGLSF